jgi:hypothetical protein
MHVKITHKGKAHPHLVKRTVHIAAKKMIKKGAKKIIKKGAKKMVKKPVKKIIKKKAIKPAKKMVHIKAHPKVLHIKVHKNGAIHHVRVHLHPNGHHLKIRIHHHPLLTPGKPRVHVVIHHGPTAHPKIVLRKKISRKQMVHMCPKTKIAAFNFVCKMNPSPLKACPKY